MIAVFFLGLQSFACDCWGKTTTSSVLIVWLTGDEISANSKNTVFPMELLWKEAVSKDYSVKFEFGAKVTVLKMVNTIVLC